MGWIRSVALLALGASACGTVPAGPMPPELDRDEALGRAIERDRAAPVQTDSLVHHLTGERPSYAVVIPFRYENDTGRTISIVNCRGGLDIGLEKREGEDWEEFFRPVLLMCLSPPIQIAPGAVFAATANINGALPGFHIHPEFASPDLDGEYRLVWRGLVHGYDEDRQGFGDAIGPLHSNPFLLVAPAGR